ncbi:MAG: NAD(P)H-dependent glycerol-3-phosphate dehydrogenase [Paracoccaceae bacterium]
MTIAVIGAGAFGTAMAITLGRIGPVTLLGRNAERMKTLQDTRENQTHLPNARLPATVQASANNSHLEKAEIILLCLPTQHLSEFLSDHTSALSNKSLVACCKGIDLKTLTGPVDIILQKIPNATASILTGPSFATDIAQGLPTALTIASSRDFEAERLQKTLSSSTLRLYRTTDVIGAQLGGALKNVIAIAAGACIGARLGESARAALIARGFAEMQRLAHHFGAKPETLMGLSGFGDLILTCSSAQSRNFSYGLAIGSNASYDPTKTVEGAATAQALTKIAKLNGLDLPVCACVNDLVSGRTTVTSALKDLLARPLTHE